MYIGGLNRSAYNTSHRSLSGVEILKGDSDLTDYYF